MLARRLGSCYTPQQTLLAPAAHCSECIYRPGAQPFGWSQDPRGIERAELLGKLEAEDRWRRLLVDAPRHLDLSSLCRDLRRTFPFVRSTGYLSTHLGAVSARKRQVIWRWKDGESPPPADLDSARESPPPSMQMIRSGRRAKSSSF